MTEPLLCELHAHTTWSDGALTVAELVDLYGREGFDVLGVTDHVVRPEDPWGSPAFALRASTHAAYLDEIAAEAERAAALYGLLLIPGLELTFDDHDPCRAAHALALGTRLFTNLDGGLDAALEAQRAHGAALVGAHPYAPERLDGSSRTTARYAADRDWAVEAVDRFEICNRHDFFDWVSRDRLPVVANGDFHQPEHLVTWKTALTAEKSEEAIVDYLRSTRPVSLVLVERVARTLEQAA